MTDKFKKLEKKFKDDVKKMEKDNLSCEEWDKDFPKDLVKSKALTLIPQATRAI